MFLSESGESQELTLSLLDTGNLSLVSDDAWVQALLGQLLSLSGEPQVVSGHLGPEVVKLEGLLLLLVEGDLGVVDVDAGDDGVSGAGGGSAEGVVGADGGSHAGGVLGGGGDGGHDGGQDCEDLHLFNWGSFVQKKQRTGELSQSLDGIYCLNECCNNNNNNDND